MRITTKGQVTIPQGIRERNGFLPHTEVEFVEEAGMDMIRKTRQDHLEVAPLANTAMKMSMMGIKGADNAGIPNIMGMLPGMTAFATKLMKDKMKALGVPPIGEYLQMMVDGGAKLYACKMSVDMFGLKKEDFVDGVIDIVTAGDFMDMTAGAQVIFI